MSTAKYPAAWINAVYEEGDFDEAIRHLQKTWDNLRDMEAVTKLAVEALRNVRAGRVGDQLIMNPEAYIDAQLRQIEESGWTP